MIVYGYKAGPRANLGWANLGWANLRGANLGGADLQGADLRGADLTGANLAGASLHGAYLTWANLTRADLTRANLARADLTEANLTEADLTGTCLDPAAPCPPLPDAATLAQGGLTLRRVRGRDRVYGSRTADSQHVGSHDYRPRRWHVAPWFSVDASTECHPGIYLGGTGYRDQARVECWAYADETVWISATKGARARRIYVTGPEGGER